MQLAILSYIDIFDIYNIDTHILLFPILKSLNPCYLVKNKYIYMKQCTMTIYITIHKLAITEAMLIIQYYVLPK